jgi:uncharacterized membrane protein
VNAVSTLQSPDYRYHIQPNRSLGGREAALIVLAVGSGTFAVAGFLTVAYGAWPVLPFAGLEVLLLGWAFWRVQRRADDSEILVVGERFVEVTRHVGGCVESFRFPRYWARVSLEARAARNFPTRLRIGSHGRFVEIGSWLTDDERTTLAGSLRDRLGPCGATAVGG